MCVFVVQVVVALLNARADLRAVKSDGFTALIIAARNGHDKVRGGTQRGERGVQVHTHTQHAPGGGGRRKGCGEEGGLVVTPPELRGRAHGRGFTFGGRRLRGQLGGLVVGKPPKRGNDDFAPAP